MENFDYEKLASLIANSMKATQESSAAGGDATVKHLSDLKLEDMEKRLTARLDALEKENRELREANAELYAEASKRVLPDPESPPEQNGTSAVSSASVVESPATVKAAEASKKSFEDMYKNAAATLGYPAKQSDGM